ncbi:MAG: hypothetical protein KAR20_09690, partial [Candidatus Heimdallarchaeota archaeon]|nr:hypothetical protein [Candidatus Heimdallarchaeota archaeon]
MQKDVKVGEYVFKITKQQYFIEILSGADDDIEFSMFLRFAESSLFSKDEVGLSYDNAIPLNPSKQLTGKVRRNNQLYYKFKVARRNYINITLYYNQFEGDIDMKIYSETKDKKREIIEGASSVKQNNRLYYRGYLEIGIYYVIVKSNALKPQVFRIRMYGGSTVIASGSRFQDPILIRADSKEYEFDVTQKNINESDDKAHSNKWMQFNINSFGELKIEYKITQGTIDSDEDNHVELNFIGNKESDVLLKNPFKNTDSYQSMKSLVGIGVYHINLKNFTSSSLKIMIRCTFNEMCDNLSYEKAQKLPNEPIVGLMPIKNESKRYFVLNAQKDGILQVYSTFKLNKGDINLILYDAKKKLVNSAKTKGNDEILLSQLEKGSYFLEIENITKGLENNINLLIDFTPSDS